MTGGGSVVVRRQLGAKLRQLRLAAGKDVIDVTEAGLGSKAKISRIETGKGPVRVADVRALCWLYGVDAASTDALAAMAPGTQQDDWWEVFGESVVPDWFGLAASLEAIASRIRSFEPGLVHGLVQTPDYARATFQADPRLDESVIAKRVEFRMERQRRVLERGGQIDIVLHESALTMVVGSADVMRAQVDHLVSQAARPNVSIRVLPFAAGAYPSSGTFRLMDFDDPDDPSVAYVEMPYYGARYVDTPRERAEYEFVFDLVAAKSLPIEDWRKQHE
ncbi:helix-turn-helix domain-containing protein [Pseudonocardia sp. CA-107938]|uniref:helix-turn-helix domain-containing protein n=1 Tax=Pseudonocardia sp. CA-107938 TaxID=3240021 RepID=UPI003D89ED0E